MYYTCGTFGSVHDPRLSCTKRQFGTWIIRATNNHEITHTWTLTYEHYFQIYNLGYTLCPDSMIQVVVIMFSRIDHSEFDCWVLFNDNDKGNEYILFDRNVWLKVTKNSQCCKFMYELMFTNLNYFKLHF